MRLRGLLWFNAVFSIMPVALLASAIVEGQVELPKSHTAPIQAKRYEIVTKGGVLSTQPPLAVIYLDGALPKPASLPTKQVAQKDLTFVPALRISTTLITTSFPIRLPNGLTSGVIARMNVLFRHKFSTSRVWSHCGATFTNICVG